MSNFVDKVSRMSKWLHTMTEVAKSCKNYKIFVLSAYWMVGTYLPSSTTKLLGLWPSFFPTMVHLHFLLVGFFSWLLMHSETSHKTTAPVPINCNINIQLVLSNKSKLLMFHNNVIYIIKTSDHHKSLPYTYTQLTDQSSNHVT